MSEKPSPKPSAGKAPATGAASAAKARVGGDADEAFDFLSPPKQPNEIGRLAQFRVLKVLGRGGMGTVFMAEDTSLHRIVALKVMLPSIAKKEIARDRFRREARATAAIEHDHIITIYEVSKEDAPIPYAAMQYLKGMTLEDWLKAGKSLNVPQIMRIGKEIAKGLAAAHTRQLIHRDIKPSNIWLDAVNKGRVKILDFGLARPTNEETRLTQEGMILGTPAYMSPEQARGQQIDERSDLFSLGCVLYRLCTGKLPFAGKDPMSMLLAITSDEPAAAEPMNADVPPAFAALVHKLLAKKPEDRPVSANEVVRTIQAIERDWMAGARTITGKSPVVTPPPDHEEIDPALEESAITEMELQQPSNPALRPAPLRGRAWLIGGLGCAGLIVLSMLCCLGIVLATDRGQIEIVAADDIAHAHVETHGLSLRGHHKNVHSFRLGTHTLPAGSYEFDKSGLPTGIQVAPASFSVHRNDTVKVTVSFVPPSKPIVPARPELVVFTTEDAKNLQRIWATFLKRDLDDKNSLEGKMKLIPPGEFSMGSDRELVRKHVLPFFKKPEKFGLTGDYSSRVNAETPQHRVQITKPFYLSVTEVTVGQFKKFVVDKGYKTEASAKGGTGLDAGRELPRNKDFDWVSPGPGYLPTDDHPVSNITWKDAEAFCAWLSDKEKKTYRLPTEAEWEYACRSGSADFWYFGDDPIETIARGHMWYQAPFKFSTNNPISPNPVGTKKANAFGLRDMHGNVAEMCIDWWGPGYYERCLKEEVVADPKGPEVGAGGQRVVRGGSFLDPIHAARSAYRNSLNPSLGYVTVGFRVVCEVPE